MKRPAMPRRTTRIRPVSEKRAAKLAAAKRRTATIARTSALRKRNAKLKPRGESKRKKEARYKAYLSSPAWKTKRKEALERAGHRCEYEYAAVVDADTGRQIGTWMKRCPETTRLHVHHLTYARFGDERPEDLQVLCAAHHRYVERSQHPHRQSHSQRQRGAA